MKSLFTLLLIIVSFSLNSQILGWHLNDISKHVDCQNLKYFVNEHCQLTHISSRMDTCTFVEYLIGSDSICYSMIVQSRGQNTEKIINNFCELDYLKISDGWLTRVNGSILKIYYLPQEDGSTLFLWQ